MSRSISLLGALAITASSCSADPPRTVEAPAVSDARSGQPPDHGSSDAGRDDARPVEAGASDGSSDGAAPDAPDVPPVLDARTLAALRDLRYDAAPPPKDPSNPYAELPSARALGHRLFFDPSLSGRLLAVDNDGTLPTLGRRGEPGRTSCAGCHVPASGFFDTRSPHQQISLAAQWTRRRTPTLLESAFLPVFNWDGRHDTPWSQALGVMESPVEFNSSRLFIAQQMFRLHRAEYESVFGPMPPLDDTAHFPSLDALVAGCGEGPTETAGCRGKPGDGAEYDKMAAADRDAVTRVMVNAAKAIAAYLTQLRCGESRFDRWVDGEVDALTPGEQRGAALFVGHGRCVSCHSGPRLTDGGFHNLGLRPSTVAVAFTDSGDRGAAEGLALALKDPLESSGAYSDGPRHTLPDAVTPAHEGAFRTPTLRCADRAPSFLHTGQMRTLDQVVAFFDMGGSPPPGYPGTNELVPLGLTTRERSDLVAFLHTLTGSGPPEALLSPPSAR
jgi:cytochrome c peroxidase